MQENRQYFFYLFHDFFKISRKKIKFGSLSKNVQSEFQNSEPFNLRDKSRIFISASFCVKLCLFRLFFQWNLEKNFNVMPWQSRFYFLSISLFQPILLCSNICIHSLSMHAERAKNLRAQEEEPKEKRNQCKNCCCRKIVICMHKSRAKNIFCETKVFSWCVVATLYLRSKQFLLGRTLFETDQLEKERARERGIKNGGRNAQET